MFSETQIAGRYQINGTSLSMYSQQIPFGEYCLHELINSGGMADIWTATNQKGETVALRLLADRLKYDFIAKRRFLRGCEILAHIHNHEYVIGYLEHGKIDGTPYLVMEYVESSNLKQLYARVDPILEEFLGNILIDMAVAVEHVHDSGFMHLDFKPENVLATRNGNVRLVDFDLARPRPKKPKRLWRYPGTPAYMAPELLLRKPIDHRADIFAYGVTAYELLTYRKPFSDERADIVLREQLDRTAFVSPREYNPDIPIALEKTILKCLETDPENRYPHMSILVRDLEAALYV